MINHWHLIRYARHFIVVAFLVAAIVTPPDVVSQLLLAIPLCILVRHIHSCCVGR